MKNDQKSAWYLSRFPNGMIELETTTGVCLVYERNIRGIRRVSRSDRHLLILDPGSGHEGDRLYIGDKTFYCLVLGLVRDVRKPKAKTAKKRV